MTAFLAAPLQQAIFNQLERDETLGGLLRGIHDAVPEGAELPYLMMGEASAEGAALKDVEATAVTVVLFVLSDEPSQMQAKELMAAVDDCVNRFCPHVPGARCGEMSLQSAAVVRQVSESGSRYRGRLTYRVKLYEDKDT